jgi:hypothetical protein
MTDTDTEEHDDFCNCEDCFYARGELVCHCCGCLESSCNTSIMYEPESDYINETDYSELNGSVAFL